MSRIVILAALVCLLLPGGAAAQQRPQCGSLFPLSLPPKPGACFVNTPIGAFFFLVDADNDFLLVETYGDTDDQVKLRPNGRISAHQTARQARFIFCPAGVTGRDCLQSIFQPGRRAFAGWGRLSVNTDANVFFSYTCPSSVTARATVTDPQTGADRRLVMHQIRTRNRDGSCRDVLDDIRLAP